MHECSVHEKAYFATRSLPLMRHGERRSDEKSTMHLARETLTSRRWKDPEDAARLNEKSLSSFRKRVCYHSQGVMAAGAYYKKSHHSSISTERSGV